MTLILCSISQDCIPLLDFEARFSFELILCNQLWVSKVIFALLQAWTCKTRKLKVSYKWCPKRGALGAASILNLPQITSY